MCYGYRFVYYFCYKQLSKRLINSTRPLLNSSELLRTASSVPAGVYFTPSWYAVTNVIIDICGYKHLILMSINFLFILNISFLHLYCITTIGYHCPLKFEGIVWFFGAQGSATNKLVRCADLGYIYGAQTKDEFVYSHQRCYARCPRNRSKGNVAFMYSY